LVGWLVGWLVSWLVGWFKISPRFVKVNTICENKESENTEYKDRGEVVNVCQCVSVCACVRVCETAFCLLLRTGHTR
jgi:hypothetical protein